MKPKVLIVDDVPKLPSAAVLAALNGSVARRQMRCPKCDWPGVYIRTRYFETMTADVWMCDNSKCESYRLYWHDDKPLNVKVSDRADNAHSTAERTQ
jgi:hypothetical protein